MVPGLIAYHQSVYKILRHVRALQSERERMPRVTRREPNISTGELRKDIPKWRIHPVSEWIHTRRIHSAIFVHPHVVALFALWIGEDVISFGDKFEFFFVPSLWRAKR